jgi:hypothetical protein
MHALLLMSAAVAVSFSLNSLVRTGEAPQTIADFAKLHKELTTAKEPWQSIPWHLSILEARTQAAKENKPVYMLCRAGHPLGCV